MTDSEIATVGIWSYGLAAVGFVAFAVRLAMGWRSGVRAWLLLAAIVTTVFWALAGIAVAWRPGFDVWIASTTADALRYAVWFLFLGSLLARNQPAAAKPRGVPNWLILLVAVGLLACLIVPEHPPFAPVDDATGLMPAFGLRLGLAIFGLVLLEQLIRRADRSAHWALRPLCIGLAGVFAFDLYYFADAMMFGRLDVDVWIARGAANALVIPFIVVAAARNPGWTVEMHVSRVAVFHSTAILLSGAFLLLVAGAGYIVRYFGGEWGRALQIELVFFALLVGMLAVSSGSFRSKLRVFISKHFFSYRYDYREEWLRFTRTLAEATRSRDVEEQTIRALADLVESPGGALWLRYEDQGFKQVVTWNMPAIGAIEPETASLPHFLESEGWVVDLAEYRANRALYRDLQIPGWLDDLPSAWLVVPLVSGSDMVGFVVLAKSRATVEVNWEVRDLLKVASRQAASYLGQVRATEALVEGRKFEAFNRMSAFVVHDLKNLVAQLSLMLRNAERHRDNPEFQKDMLATVENVVGRMNQLMLQLRTGATPLEKARLTDLEAVVRAVCAARAGSRPPIEADLRPGLLALGHVDRLQHVIGHLVQNALDATSGNEPVRIRSYSDGGQSVIEVTDSGAGMTAEFVRERLFKPFETSKRNGMGIGVYESAQYVSSLGGQILYESTPGAGTCVRVLLPVAASTVAVAPEEAST